MAAIAFDDISKLVTKAATVKSPPFTTVMALELKLRLTRCVYCGRLAGTLVSALFPKLRMATGVVTGIFLMIVSIFESSSPWLAQSIESVLLSPLVGRQVQGRMDATGH